MDEFQIIKAKSIGNFGEYILLCHIPGNVTPWVTWRSNSIDGKDRYWGHYFYEGQEELARQDFEDR